MQRFGWVLEHTEPQAPCIFDCDGAPSVDFIGRVEHIEEDMLVRRVEEKAGAVLCVYGGWAQVHPMPQTRWQALSISQRLGCVCLGAMLGFLLSRRPGGPPGQATRGP